MEDNSNNELEVILKLIKLTVDEKLSWSVSKNIQTGIIGDSYQTFYKDWELVIYKVRVMEKTTSRGMLSTSYRLKILSLSTKKATIMKENQQVLKDLYNTIDNKSSKLDEFISSILKE